MKQQYPHTEHICGPGSVEIFYLTSLIQYHQALELSF